MTVYHLINWYSWSGVRTYCKRTVPWYRALWPTAQARPNIRICKDCSRIVAALPASEKANLPC